MQSVPVTRAGGPLQEVLNAARERFVATFAARYEAIRTLVEAAGASDPQAAIAALTQATHQLSGLAGTIGFPTISLRASELERMLDALVGPVEPVRARSLVEAIEEAYTADLARPPEWAVPATSTTPGARILLAEGESDQRAIVTACLEGAGHVPIAVLSGDLVVETARAEKPALILLDIAMPGLDGYSACRLLKADPELAAIPVLVMTTGAHLDDRRAGLTLAADQFLSKPVDMRELVLRIQLLLDRARPSQLVSSDPTAPASRLMTSVAFLAAARGELAREPAALAVVSLPADRRHEASLLLAGEMRVRDLIGALGRTRLAILMPEMTAAGARDRLEPLVERLAAGVGGVCAGVTAAAGAGTRTAEALIGEADEALAEARQLGAFSAIWAETSNRPAAVPVEITIVLAEDDPEVTRIVDAQVRAAGYTAIVARDGEEALAAVRAHTPDVVVLDLMMPKIDGFEVLTQIRSGPAPRPRVIVLSGRGREQDVMRAFELGADDYVTKPFNPQELMARIARLLK